MSKHCPICDGYMYPHENSDEYFCINCIYDEHYENVKNDILYIVEDAFNYIRLKCNEKGVHAPNGEYWDYNDVMRFLRENLK